MSVATPHPQASRPAAPEQPVPVLALHGVVPGTTLPVTYHVSPAGPAEGPGRYLVEHAYGQLQTTARWMQAERHARLADEAEVLTLVRAVLAGEA